MTRARRQNPRSSSSKGMIHVRHDMQAVVDSQEKVIAQQVYRAVIRKVAQEIWER